MLVFIGIVRYGPSPLPPTEEEKLKAELESEYSKWPDSGIKTAPVVPNPATDTPPVQQPTTPRFTVEQQPPSDSIEQPLPECSVVFFHHLEKTAGTTVRSILQRNAQLGHYDFFSFINRFNKLQFQTVTHRLDTLISQGPSALKGLRLAVEIHIGGGGYEHFIKYTLPDLLLLRKKLRAAGCRCNLVTLLRHPLTAHMSWHHHFVNQRVPLCFWNSPFDCQARMSIALACHGGPAVHPLTTDHHTAISKMWALFDLVGVTEHFDEFIVMLADLVGLPSVAYRSQMATKKTTEARVLAMDAAQLRRSQRESARCIDWVHTTEDGHFGPCCRGEEATEGEGRLARPGRYDGLRGLWAVRRAGCAKARADAVQMVRRG